MTYEEALNYIHSLDKFGSRPGLDRVRRLFNLEPSSLNQHFIHIAGTNGKGSVSTVLSAVLQESGLKVGLFISPYIIDFRERIQINNEMISEDELTEAVEHFLPLMKKLNSEGIIITEFEFLTVLAFWVYKRNRCDIVVCEVGMGGLLDSTNLIPFPMCSVITRVDLDHTAVLGDTIEEIAEQKAGIIKSYSTTVVAAQRKEAFAVIEQKAREEHNTLYRAEDIRLTVTEHTLDGTRFIYRDTEMLLPLLGAHQVANLRCALAALEALEREHNLSVTPEQIRNSLRKVKHPARFERLRTNPTVILDGAHNNNGLTAFTDAVRGYFPEGGKTLVIGMLADKNNDALGLLKGMFKRVICTDIDNPRALSAEDMAGKMLGLSPYVEIVHDPQEAYDKAVSYGDDVFICGSLYLASEIRAYILKK